DVRASRDGFGTRHASHPAARPGLEDMIGIAPVSVPMNGSGPNDLTVFQSHRAHLVALAYRMLGDLGRAEDMVQDAWLRWQGRAEEEVESPRTYLVTIVTRLCLSELDSAKSRRAESRSDRLPEAIEPDQGGHG